MRKSIIILFLVFIVSLSVPNDYFGLSDDDQLIAANDANIGESKTSKLGHIRHTSVKIFKTLEDLSNNQEAGSTYTNAVYYIKKEAKLNNELYYLISKEPSSTSGVVGWVKAEDMSTHIHVGVDKEVKTFYFKGTGSAYSKAWGGSKDIVYNEMSVYKGEEFRVHLTEKVGTNIWYRGKLNGEVIWLHSSFVTSTPIKEVNIEESKTSKLGHIRHTNVEIFKTLEDLSNNQKAGSTYTNAVYYVKKEAKLKDELYYLISKEPSSTSGVVGWVKAKDMSTHTHVGVDKETKTFYIKGTGSAYSKAWGGSEDIVYNEMSVYKGEEFRVHLTEKVGTNTWYRGKLNEEVIWLHSSFVTSTPIKEVNIEESKTSKLGHIRHTNVEIFKNLEDLSNNQKAGSTYTNAVYYIKKEAKLNDELYYLISKEPSSTSGVVGWVKAKDMSTHTHVGVDKETKTFYIKGTGSAYSKAWGGSKDIVYNEMSAYKGEEFRVHLTEKVGTNTWYRGKLNGEVIWLHSSFVTSTPIKEVNIEESKTSRLGHIRYTDVEIYKTLEDISTSQEAGSTYSNAVYYIKKEAELDKDLYYLISKEPSSTSGVVGWVKAEDMSTHTHVGVDKETKTFYIKGTGSAYSKAWGGSKDIVYNKMSAYKGEEFRVHLTEKVGTNTWYRGKLNGKTMWLHSSFVNETNLSYTNYDISLAQMLTKQMRVNPQTDKYRNAAIWVHGGNLVVSDGKASIRGTITGSSVNVRSEANLSSKVIENVSSGTRFEYLGNVTGESWGGSKTWYKIRYKSQEAYVHSSLASASVSYYESASSTSHRYGSLSFSSPKSIVSTSGSWYRLNTSVTWRSAKYADVKKYVDPDLQDNFQFLVLSESVNVDASELNKILTPSNAGVLANKGNAYIEAGAKYGVNETYLISHSLLESGWGTSELAKGVEVGENSDGVPILVTKSNRSSLQNIKTVYNFYGVGAKDGQALSGGAKTAYEKNWFSIEEAIIGGAEFVSNSYFESGQNTLYKMRWNPANPATHQYATDIGWASKQIVRIKEMYDLLENPDLVIDIPKYK